MRKIMLMDAEDASADNVAKALNAEGYGTCVAKSLQELLDGIPAAKPELIVLDADTKGSISAGDICAEIRKCPDSFAIPIIALSSDASKASILDALGKGADDFILKPLKPGELAAKASILIARRSLHGCSEMPPDTLFAGHYRILRTLGRGGYSTVYLAEDTRDSSKLALKILSPKCCEPKFVTQFLREAAGLSQLNHKCIVRLLGFGSFAGRHYIATSFVEGQSLGSLILNSPVSESYALRIASEMLDALSYMNMSGTVHRDIKPDNILITHDGSVALVDFGLARKERQDTISPETEMQGTPEYLAPEYIRGDKRQGIKMDIYSLGITLFHAVSGVTPFSGTPCAIVNDHLSKPPPKLSEMAPFISAAFSSMVDRMLVKEPRRRCGLKELAELIERSKNASSGSAGKMPTSKRTAQAKASKPSVSKETASLAYHQSPAPGKIHVLPSKPCETQQDLSLAYTPGVAIPCLSIKEHPDDVWKYTSRGNMVAVVSDGTAVLGLGSIGPEAGLPVMEGKAVLFKKFADIDAMPLCLSSVFKPDGKTDPKLMIETVQRLAPTFGGINLEDIAAPACFEIETTLKRTMSIPVFHDDQHGTAIISLAGILNALKIVGKRIQDCRFVMNGAGAAGIACAEYYILAGASRELFTLCDSKGVIHKGRTDLTPEKARFAHSTEARTLADAMKGADIFIGVSVAGAVSEDMVRSMDPGAIVFAMANPTPEIFPDKALAAGAAVAGTGRSDFHNQVNNVLGFPGIFRGALDVRATDINDAMKLAASQALAEIVSEKIPDSVYCVLSSAYPEDAKAGLFDGSSPLKNSFVIPKPFDPRVVPRVAARVAKAAADSGLAQCPVSDYKEYEHSVARRIREASI